MSDSVEGGQSSNEAFNNRTNKNKLFGVSPEQRTGLHNQHKDGFPGHVMISERVKYLIE